MTIPATGPCPHRLRGVRGAVAGGSWAPDYLLPPGLTAIGALICEYGGLNASSGYGALVLSTRVSATDATGLATAIVNIDLRAPSGPTSCPADFGDVTEIAVGYPGGHTVDLRYHASGCETLGNGRATGYEIGNPSFYDRFAKVFRQVTTRS